MDFNRRLWQRIDAAAAVPWYKNFGAIWKPAIPLTAAIVVIAAVFLLDHPGARQTREPGVAPCKEAHRGGADARRHSATRPVGCSQPEIVMSVLRKFSIVLTAAMLLLTPAFAQTRQQARQQVEQERGDEQLFRRSCSAWARPRAGKSSRAQLPPAQQANIEKRIQNFQKLPQAQREQARTIRGRLKACPRRNRPRCGAQ